MQKLFNRLLLPFKKQSPSELVATEREADHFGDALIYDCEVVNCIPNWGEELDPNLKYCSGWDDFDGMGISVIGAYDFRQDRYRIFLEDNFQEFQKLVDDRKAIIGFNSLCFDDKLCEAHGLKVSTTYDLLAEVRVASGQPRYYVKGVTRGGYSLEKLTWANLGYGKSGSGSLAPELWQRGQQGAVIDYCLQDVEITRRLFDRRLTLTDPTNGETLILREDPTLPEHQSADVNEGSF